VTIKSRFIVKDYFNEGSATSFSRIATNRIKREYQPGGGYKTPIPPCPLRLKKRSNRLRSSSRRLPHDTRRLRFPKGSLSKAIIKQYISRDFLSVDAMKSPEYDPILKNKEHSALKGCPTLGQTNGSL